MTVLKALLTSTRRALVCALASLVVLFATALTPAPALALPEGRVYEMVSPPFKGGYGVGGLGGQIKAVAPDGESVAFFSKGAFAGAPSGPTTTDYVATRGVSGWSTASVMVPATLLPSIGSPELSSSLGSIVFPGKPGPNVIAAKEAGTESEFWFHNVGTPDTVANWELAGIPLKALHGEIGSVTLVGASADLCRLFVEASGQDLLPEAVGTEGQIYELDRGCGGEPRSLRLVGVKNALGPNGEPEIFVPSCEAALRSEVTDSRFNAVSADGREVFFSKGLKSVGEKCLGGEQLFVRLDGKRTLEVSKPVSEAGACGGEIPCPGAQARGAASFVGASEDGSRVFFTTAAPLDPATDTDTGVDLYMARIDCPSGEEGCEVAGREVTSLVQVSHDPVVGQAAEVQGVVRVSPDGSRVYFVARGVLGEGANVEGLAPVRGADNLYVYDSVSGKTVFVADLCSGPGVSGPGGSVQAGAVEDARCPPQLTSLKDGRNDLPLWVRGDLAAEAQTAGLDGGFLVFSSYGQLAGGDTDAARDVYRYDAVTGVLSRVSLGEAGYDANGNNSSFDASIQPGHQGGHVAEQYEMDNRAVSEDGSRIVFSTAEPLSPAAVNHLANIYEWHGQPGDGEGSVSLVSGGSAEEPEGVVAESVVISPSGNDIFFVTSQGLVPQDTDGELDIYDARLAGGFPEQPAPRQPCAGDACQGPLTNPAALLVPGSVSQAPGGNFAAPVVAKAKPKAKPKKKKRSVKRHGKARKSFRLNRRRSK